MKQDPCSKVVGIRPVPTGLLVYFQDDAGIKFCTTDANIDSSSSQLSWTQANNLLCRIIVCDNLFIMW